MHHVKTSSAYFAPSVHARIAGGAVSPKLRDSFQAKARKLRELRTQATNHITDGHIGLLHSKGARGRVGTAQSIPVGARPNYRLPKFKTKGGVIGGLVSAVSRGIQGFKERS